MNYPIPQFDSSKFVKTINPLDVRIGLGWGQPLMGETMGYTQSQISRWEAGRCKIPKLAQEKYWQLWFENGLHEKQNGANAVAGRGEHAL